MRNRLTKNLMLAAMGMAITLSLSGCATSNMVNEMQNSGAPAALQRYEAARVPTRENRSFIVDDGFYAARRPIAVTPVNSSVPLPPSFMKETALNVQTPISISEIGARITKLTGFPVTIDQDVLGKSRSGGSVRAAAAPSAAPMALPSGGPLPDPSAPPGSLPPLVSMEAQSADQSTVLNDVIYRGHLSGLLDEVTGRLNLSWRWTGSRVEIFRYETKMFRLNALAGKTTSSANLDTTSSTSSGGGGGSSSGGAGVEGSSGSNTSVSSDMDTWKEVQENVEALLSSDGTLSMAPGAGLLTVRDTPAVLRQVEAQITEFNRVYTRQVMLNVEVYAVENNRTENYGLDWNILWATASNSLGFSFSSVGDGSAGQAFTVGVDDPSSPFNGSNVVAKALSTMGKSTLLTSGTVISLNGQTVPLNVSREQAYLQSSSTNFNGGDSNLATTTLTPGIATEGFSMNFTPRVLDNNNVLIRYAVDLSVIEEIETFSAPGGSAAIQLPRRSVRNFLQNVSVRSGQTLVLTGFQQASGNSSGQGPFSPSAWMLGGSKGATTTNRTIVIVVTPYVTN